MGMTVAACGANTCIGQSHQVFRYGPAGSEYFGVQVVVLANGHFVVTDPRYDAPGPIVDVGAVYLFRANGTQISTLRGSTAGDQVGLGGVVPLSNGNFVVLSPSWDSESANVGAVTFVSGSSGLDGEVSANNSLVGSTAEDRVGENGATALGNSNYVVVSKLWNNGAAVDAGAVTLGSGLTGISGVVSVANSLVGSQSGDKVGEAGIKLVGGENYLVMSPAWDNGAVTDAGALTFGSGTNGVNGSVSAVNSLVGSSVGDMVGNLHSVTVLTNGNFVTRTPSWDNGAVVEAGAVTFGSGATGISGPISASNSLVGTGNYERLGSSGVFALSNNNYVVASPFWHHGDATFAGAVTFASGATGIVGNISASNSLVGSTQSDLVGLDGVVPLSNGNYAVPSPSWDDGGLPDVGAVTFGSGTTGVSGVVSEVNSLVGSAYLDAVGSIVVALENGNYVVQIPSWDNGAIENVGAVTFGSGVTGIAGRISVENSYIGSAANDEVGSYPVTPLTNGNFVISSPKWDNGSIVDAGAATFCLGQTGGGIVSAANSLVGSRANDQVSEQGATALTNGNYVVKSPNWDRVSVVNAGAATFGSGTTGIIGEITPSNSLVGSANNDNVGAAVTALSGGNYVVQSLRWANGAATRAGAATFGFGTTGITGEITAANSLVGTYTDSFVSNSGVTAYSNGHYLVLSPLWNLNPGQNNGAVTFGLSDGSLVGQLSPTNSVTGTAPGPFPIATAYDAVRNQLIVGQRFERRVTMHRTGIPTYISMFEDTPDPLMAGLPATFSAIVQSIVPNRPDEGVVTFRAASGESCVDNTFTVISGTEVRYSCSITFNSGGTTGVIAEYTGSVRFAFSGSEPEPHESISNVFFADGFEAD